MNVEEEKIAVARLLELRDERDVLIRKLNKTNKEIDNLGDLLLPQMERRMHR